MNSQNLFKKIALSVPSVKHYVQEKVALEDKLKSKDKIISSKDKIIADLKKEVDGLIFESQKSKGIVPNSTEIIWPVLKDDILMSARPTSLPEPTKKKPPFRIIWVIPPMGKASGGHTSIFRFIAYLESCGHKNYIYFYDTSNTHTLNVLNETMQENYPHVQAETYYNEKEMLECDAIFATNWFTAYPVINYTKPAKKYYFVQDFEPWFEAAGSYSALAENTYRFKLHGITYGDWLKNKLTSEYEMQCDSLPFGVDVSEYTLLNTNRRQDVLFYARPVTPRRGFEMGILTLETFHKNNPQSNIHLAGWDVGNFKINFPYKNHGIISPEELNLLYNQCAAGLTLSFTSMSLLPLEMMAAGCTPVVNDGPNTRNVRYSQHLEYAKPNPRDLALKLEDSVHKSSNVHNVIGLAKAARKYTWDSSYERLNSILIRDLS